MMRFLLLMVLLALGCGDRKAAETHELLHRIEAISIEASTVERRARIDHLEALPLVTPELEEPRSVCARAHRALLDAEEAQRKAREVLANEGTPPAEEQARAARALIASNEALLEARELLPRCEALRNGLRAPRR